MTENAETCNHEWVTVTVFKDDSYDQFCLKCLSQRLVQGILTNEELDDLMTRIYSSKNTLNLD